MLPTAPESNILFMAKLKNGEALVEEIVTSLNSLGGWGSLEIFVQDYKVTQMTKREISKTNHSLKTIDFSPQK